MNEAASPSGDWADTPGGPVPVASFLADNDIVVNCVLQDPGSGASRNRTCEVRVRGHARSVVVVGCRSRTAFTGGLAPELQPAVAVCAHRNDGIRDERR